MVVFDLCFAARAGRMRLRHQWRLPQMKMRLRIRTKFIGILVIAAVLPLVIALVAAQLLGYRYYRTAQGELFSTKARHIAGNLSLAVNRQLEDLDEWLILADIHSEVRTHTPVFPASVPHSERERIQWFENNWSKFSTDSPEITAILNQPLSVQLKTFRFLNPRYAELLLTNSSGELVAATQKTSDYWQADEAWWKEAIKMPSRNAFIEGINFDESAQVYSIDIAYPIRDPAHPEANAIGVIKGVVDVTTLLASLESSDPNDQATRQVIMGTGEVLVHLAGKTVRPLDERISEAATSQITKRESGWLVSSLGDDQRQLIGFAALHLLNRSKSGVSEVKPMYVLIYQPVHVALAPVRQQMFIVAGIGVGLLAGFALAGYYIAGKKIIDPIEHLRSAVRSIAESAKISSTAPELPERKIPALDRIRRIKTGDELEALAGDFAYMAQKVAGYHEELEAEIADKTAEIHRDLQMAREFQEALMPRSYPKVPSADSTDALSLNFHHIYKPASSVGGDFFDVMKLSDHSAGIFIADVMGHGARSALVTAILRTLLQDFAGQGAEPAQFLELMNRNFHNIVSQSNEFIFVSAFYLVIDTRAATATFASAGHPPPFFADRARARVAPLIKDLHDNPALGLMPESTYRQWKKSVIAGDVFVLFTDGLHEATDTDGREYELERLRAAIIENIDRPPEQLNQAIMDDVTRFIGSAPVADDICLVTIEVAAETAHASQPISHQRERAPVS